MTAFPFFFCCIEIHGTISFSQVPMCLEEGLTSAVAIQLQTFLGLATSLGSFLFGLIVLSRSQQCLISKQYLLQASMVGIGKNERFPFFSTEIISYSVPKMVICHKTPNIHEEKVFFTHM